MIYFLSIYLSVHPSICSFPLSVSFSVFSLFVSFSLCLSLTFIWYDEHSVSAEGSKLGKMCNFKNYFSKANFIGWKKKEWNLWGIKRLGYFPSSSEPEAALMVFLHSDAGEESLIPAESRHTPWPSPPRRCSANQRAHCCWTSAIVLLKPAGVLNTASTHRPPVPQGIRKTTKILSKEMKS